MIHQPTPIELMKRIYRFWIISYCSSSYSFSFILEDSTIKLIKFYVHIGTFKELGELLDTLKPFLAILFCIAILPFSLGLGAILACEIHPLLLFYPISPILLYIYLQYRKEYKRKLQSWKTSTLWYGKEKGKKYAEYIQKQARKGVKT